VAIAAPGRAVDQDPAVRLARRDTTLARGGTTGKTRGNNGSRAPAQGDAFGEEGGIDD
jgi:hypothetical protein